jgi:phosphoserine phosphatase RsbU/P
MVKPSARAGSHPNAQPLAGMDILMVGNDPREAEVLGRILAGQGAVLRLATTAAEAVALSRARRPQVAMIGWSVPGGALSAIEEIRATPAFVHIVVLMRQPSRSDQAKAMHAGADEVLVFPFLAEVLIQRMLVARRLLALEEGLRVRNQELEAMRQRMETELAMATKVQASLLPPVHLEIPGLRAAWAWRPCSTLGGDLLGVVRLDETRVAAWIIDVSGHGIPSALLAVQVARSLDVGTGSLAVDAAGAPLPPGQVLASLRRRFPTDQKTQLFFTIVYAVVDVRNGSCEISCAGHPPPVLLRGDGRCEDVDTSGLAVGWPFKVPDRSVEVRLSRGDRLLLVSDGALEAMGPDGEQFGIARVVHAFAGGLLQQGIDEALAGILAWSAGHPDDDISLLAIGIEPTARS